MTRIRMLSCSPSCWFVVESHDQLEKRFAFLRVILLNEHLNVSYSCVRHDRKPWSVYFDSILKRYANHFHCLFTLIFLPCSHCLQQIFMWWEINCNICGERQWLEGVFNHYKCQVVALTKTVFGEYSVVYEISKCLFKRLCVIFYAGTS